MEIKDFLDHMQFGIYYVYVIDSKGEIIEKREHNGNTDIYFVSADYDISAAKNSYKIALHSHTKYRKNSLNLVKSILKR